jgi:hypothetical protein
MSSFKLSLVVITTMFVFVALMSMQLIAASSVEGAAHTNENHPKLIKGRFLVSNSMEGGARRKLINDCPYIPCMGGLSCCPGSFICQGLDDVNNCGACNKKCLVGEQCCSRQCVNTLTNSTNCGFCGNVCNNVPCTHGVCGGYGR